MFDPENPQKIDLKPVPAIPKKALIGSVRNMALSILKQAGAKSDMGDEEGVADALGKFKIFTNLENNLEASRRKRQP